MSISQSHQFTPQQAEEKVKERIAKIPPLAGAKIARISDLDVLDFYAFSVLPSTGLAGEIIYLVSETELLNSGQPSDFDKIMNRLGVGREKTKLDVHKFANLFLKLRALSRGVILDKPDGYPLIQPQQLPPEKFSPPQAEFNDQGVNYSFWIFDTDRFEPVFYQVHVNLEGETTFTSE